MTMKSGTPFFNFKTHQRKLQHSHIITVDHNLHSEGLTVQLLTRFLVVEGKNDIFS